MLTLGIETSCDETSCAVLKGRDEIKSNVISSSLFRHKPFGGVVPEIASRHCLEQIDFVFEEALREAKVKPADLDLIAVTPGPGLIGSLLVGVSFAKALSFQLKIPLINVNHLEAHLAANFIGEKEPTKYIGLLVSGGHTSLTYYENGRVKMLGSTVDDAVGEAYDKVAKILGLGYPGGPILDKLAGRGNPNAFRFTKPKLSRLFGRDSNNRGTPLGPDARRFAFSFSGIKTAVLYTVNRKQKAESGKRKAEEEKFVCDMAASFQTAAVGWLVEKALAAADYKNVHDIVVGGGVSANSRLRKVLTEEGTKRGLKVWFPPLSLTSDNAAMIARRGLDLYKKGKRASLTLTGEPNLKVGS